MNELVRYPAVGRCIYCNSGEALENEHVIPFGLGGHSVILPASSCRRCAAVTGGVEAKVLRGNFRGLRERYLLPSRSKNRPRQLPLFCINGDENVKLMVDVEDYPVTIILPIFSGPTIAAFPEMVRADAVPWGKLIGWDFELLKSKYDIEQFASNSIDGWSFGRMLAKIAHADAAARIGLDNFEPLLLDLILTESVDPVKLIGTFAQVDPPAGTELNFQITGVEYSLDGVRYLGSKLRLFSNLGAPTYLIVVGVLNPDWRSLR